MVGGWVVGLYFFETQCIYHHYSLGGYCTLGGLHGSLHYTFLVCNKTYRPFHETGS